MKYILPVKKGDELTIEINQDMVFDPAKFKEELDNIKQAGFLFGRKADRAGFLALLCQTFGYSTEDIDPVLAGTSDGFDKIVDDVLDKTAEKLAVEVPVSEVAFATTVEADPPESVVCDEQSESCDDHTNNTLKMPVFLSDLDDESFKRKKERFASIGRKTSHDLSSEEGTDEDEEESEVS